MTATPDSPGATPIRIIPAMDLKGGSVVAGKGGRRDAYKPVSSMHLSSSSPFHFVERVSSLFGFSTFYVADLDSITGKGSNDELISSLAERTAFDFIVDGGYGHTGDAPRHARITPVFATESFRGWDEQGDLSRAVVSLDMKGKDMVCAVDGLATGSVLARARAKGCTRFIHLRIDAVGEKSFDPAYLMSPGRGEEWIYGGGVGSAQDMSTLHEWGYAGAIVSTMLHDGTFCQIT